MAEVAFNELPKALRTRLERRAKARNKSLEEYIVDVLEERVQAEETLARIKPLRLRGNVPLTLKMLKKARERGRA